MPMRMYANNPYSTVQMQFRMGGLVLDAAVNVYKGFVVFQPIINGIGGNLVSVQASKISTMLHQSSIIGIVPPHSTICESPWRALVNGGNALLLFTFIFAVICRNGWMFSIPFGQLPPLILCLSFHLFLIRKIFLCLFH